MKPTLRILHLEDNKLDASLIHAHLGTAKFKCLFERVETREGFQRAIDDGGFDLILSDFSLPSFDGLSALRIAKEAWPEVPFVFVSGTLGEEAAIESLKRGATDYVLKDKDKMSRLISAVERAFQEAAEREEHRRMEERVRDSDELFQQITMNVDDLIEVVDLDGKRVFCSASCGRLMGEPGSLLGTDYRSHVHPDHRATFEQVFQRTVITGVGQRTEHNVVLKNGSVRSIESQTSITHDELGKIANVVLVSRDVTERNRMAEEQLVMMRRCQESQRLESLGVLAGGIAHDFNNILGAIIGFTSLCKEELADRPEVQEQLSGALTAAMRGKELIQQILTFSRRQESVRKPVSIQAVVSEAMCMLRATLPSMVRIHEEMNPDTPRIHADATQLHQVILNLGTNAGHAMADQGGDLFVKVSSVDVTPEAAQGLPSLRPGKHVRLTVRDTGTGMDPRGPLRIFEPFFSTKLPGAGTGLGLSVVHGIVHDHGGAIHVESAPGKGTTFEVYLPALARSPEIEGRGPSLVAGTGNHEHVLFIDDEPALVLVGRIALERAGYKVTAHTNSLEALRVFRAAPKSFDLVVTDQNMPALTGTTLAVELLKIRPDLPIILTTGYSEKATVEAVEVLGIRSLLMKPYTPATLTQCIQALLPKQATPRRPALAAV